MQFFRRVFLNKASGQKLITIPSKENIKPGEYVCISKIDPNLFYPKKPKKEKGGDLNGTTKA